MIPSKYSYTINASTVESGYNKVDGTGRTLVVFGLSLYPRSPKPAIFKGSVNMTSSQATVPCNPCYYKGDQTSEIIYTV